MSVSNLPKMLRPALKALEKDLLSRAKGEPVEAGLKKTWEDEQKTGQTGFGFDPWRRERVTQLAAAWILSVVFVRTLEDRGYIDPRVAGASSEALRAAEDREALFLQVAPFLGPREYLLSVFRELAKLPGARDVFDTKHNPVWVLSPTSDGARALLDFFRKRDASGAPVLVFAGKDTRFLGDLYQDLSEAVRKRYALLQTPEFVEEFILDQTLDPAIAEFGLKKVTLIDPTCGSGHFLLGAFSRLHERWQKEAPTESIADLARHALDQVYGVDINPYAVAIARFRLVLALLDAVGINRLERAPDITPNVVVADSLLHRFDQHSLVVGQVTFDDTEWGSQLFRLGDRRDVERVLTKRYHAVAGNPPYIDEKDATRRKKYREMYESAAGKYTLAAPFTERFFGLAVEGGFVGMINASAFTKRKFGKRLVEHVLPRLDITKIVDTAGAYIPGPGIPTLLLFGRNRRPSEGPIIAVMGKRGERREPPDPANAPVWSEIRDHHRELGFDGKHVSIEAISRNEMNGHPWVLAGGGARRLLTALTNQYSKRLETLVAFLGRTTHTGDDPFFIVPAGFARRILAVDHAVALVQGKDIREWDVEANEDALFPYDKQTASVIDLGPREASFYWQHRTRLRMRRDFGQTIEARGFRWYEHSMFFPARYASPITVAFGEIATHNNFIVSRGARVFNRTAPAMTLVERYVSEGNHQVLAAYLNSSTVGFWCRLVMYTYSGDQTGEGRVTDKPWARGLQYAGSLLQQLPIPDFDILRKHILDLVVAMEETVHRVAEHAADQVVVATLATTPSLAALRDARTKSLAERSRLSGILVSLQEEMDWRVYGLFGLPTIEAPSVDAVRVPVDPNHRPFEVRLAREVATDISASEWFRVHKREPPKDVDGQLADLYRQRLRLLDDTEHGKQLRLLETPETKRRWSPPDDTKAFTDAVQLWLLERIETSFRDQSTPELRTARQLALELGRDPAVQAAHELLTEQSGLELVRLVSDLVDSDGVPFLAGYRYAEAGMEKRATWEETWRLQRLEDADKLAPELKRLNFKAIPVPDKYGPKDFLRHYWSLRGKLDVPKERFVTVPGGNSDEDTTPLVGWAGWDHLQVAQALSGLYQRRKSEDGWQKDRLVPLLAGIDERVPWLLQWHNDVDPTYGTKVGDFFRDFVAGEAHSLGLAVGDLRTWTPPAAARRTTVDSSEVLLALKNWKPEINEDENEDEEAELPEGPTEAELSSEVGVMKALIKKALKKLEADGLVEKLSGKPARYVATGDEV